MIILLDMWEIGGVGRDSSGEKEDPELYSGVRTDEGVRWPDFFSFLTWDKIKKVTDPEG